KLFNIITPDRVYFGQKDGIQSIVIKTLVRDLNLPIGVIIGPTLRESDGLAMSSRNSYLSPDERMIAPVLFQALSKAQQKFTEENERNGKTLAQIAETVIRNEPKLRLDYIDVCDLETGKEVEQVGANG